jgi:alkylation response protein AidB-like acyl-CoA dehydrogenase
MDFAPNEDQAAVLAVLDQIAADPAAAWRVAPESARFACAPKIDALLEENGFFDLIVEDSLGAVCATEVVMRLSAWPVLVEAAASALLRPLHFSDLPRPVAVVAGDATAPIPFLPMAKSLLWLRPDGTTSVAPIPAEAVRPVETIFAMPMGRIDPAALDWTELPAGDELRRLWTLAQSAELCGVLKGGLESVLEHVRERRQFGRPLGSFQAVQHRLAEAVTRIEAGRLLALRAAHSADPSEAAMALGYLQANARRIVYDLHQFMGAMGITLEHPLHRWTYRARWLCSALGGADEQFETLVTARFGAAA